MALPHYLSPEEYDELDDFLALKAEPLGGIPGLSWLDGYLAAVILSPVKIESGEWLTLSWTDGEDDESSPFKDMPEAKKMIELVMRHHEGLVKCLEKQPLDLRPILLEDPENPELPDLSGWASGFMDGLALRPDEWQDLIDSNEHQMLLLPIFLYGTDAGEEELLKEPELDDPLFMAEELPATVAGIQNFWRERKNCRC